MDQEYVGRSGDVGGYQVEVGDNRIRVYKDRVEVFGREVEARDGRSIGEFVAASGKLHLTWGRLPEGDEVILIEDAADAGPDAPGYLINVSDPALSGWRPGAGFSPMAGSNDPGRETAGG